jgi:hypothetical protein
MGFWDWLWRRPKPPKPPPRWISYTVRDEDDRGIPSALIRLRAHGYDERLVTNPNGRVSFLVPSAVTGSAQIDVEALGFEPLIVVYFPLPAGDTEVPHFTLTRIFPYGGEAGRLQLDGRHFRTADGALWLAKGSSDFTLFQRFHDGEDILPILRQRIAAGANHVRVFSMLRWDDVTFTPADWPDYYTTLDRFFAYLGRAGLRCELVLLADSTMPLPHQRAHVDTTVAIARSHWNVLLELTNEVGHPSNAVDVSRFNWPRDVLISQGSGLADAMPPVPGWSYLSFHPGRSADWPRKLKSARELEDAYGKPCANNEPMGAAEVPETGRRSTNVHDFYDAGVVAALHCTGATFHSQAGLRSELWGPVQEACARAFYQGLTAVPVEARTWTYTRGGLAECPVDYDHCSRVFVQYTQNEAWGIAVQPDPKWTLRVKWGRVIERTGGRDHVFRLGF